MENIVNVVSNKNALATQSFKSKKGKANSRLPKTVQDLRWGAFEV